MASRHLGGVQDAQLPAALDESDRAAAFNQYQHKLHIFEGEYR